MSEQKELLPIDPRDVRYLHQEVSDDLGNFILFGVYAKGRGVCEGKILTHYGYAGSSLVEGLETAKSRSLDSTPFFLAVDIDVDESMRRKKRIFSHLSLGLWKECDTSISSIVRLLMTGEHKNV